MAGSNEMVRESGKTTAGRDTATVEVLKTMAETEKMKSPPNAQMFVAQKALVDLVAK